MNTTVSVPKIIYFYAFGVRRAPKLLLKHFKPLLPFKWIGDFPGMFFPANTSELFAWVQNVVVLIFLKCIFLFDYHGRESVETSIKINLFHPNWNVLQNSVFFWAKFPLHFCHPLTSMGKYAGHNFPFFFLGRNTPLHFANYSLGQSILSSYVFHKLPGVVCKKSIVIGILMTVIILKTI